MTDAALPPLAYSATLPDPHNHKAEKMAVLGDLADPDHLVLFMLLPNGDTAEYRLSKTEAVQLAHTLAARLADWGNLDA